MWIVVALTVLATGLRLYRLRYGYAHGVTGYDDGVYFGSSLELLDGRLPYRDYVLVHPPGITVLMMPLAALAKVIGTAQAMGLAKVATALAGAAAVPFAARIVWHRGPLAVLIAAGVVAVHDDSVAAAYSLLLEPWLVLCCLAAVALAFDGDTLASGRRLRWGAVLFGLACAIKIWAVVPLLVVVVLCGRARWRGFLGAAAVGFGVVVVPFAMSAPGSFFRDVFLVQVARDPAQRISVTYRILHLFSVAPASTRGLGHETLLVTVAIVVAAVLAVATVVVLRRRTPLARFAGASAVLVVAMFFVPGDFFWHYAAFAAPFLGLVAALAVPRTKSGIKIVGVVAALSLAALTWTTLHRDLHAGPLADDSAVVAGVVPAGSCVVTEQVTSTIVDDRFFADDPDCPAIVDSFGTALRYGHGRIGAALHSPALHDLWLHAYEQADFVYRVHRPTQAVPDLNRYLAANFRIVPLPGLHGTLYARNTPWDPGTLDFRGRSR